jgi:hypothetical protein
MTTTRAVAEKTVRHIQVETGELRSDMWASIATDSIELAVQQAIADERERCAGIADVIQQRELNHRANEYKHEIAYAYKDISQAIAEEIAAAIRRDDTADTQVEQEKL